MNPRLLFTVWLTSIACSSLAQNLVPNPGFENGSCVVTYNSTPAKIPTTINDWYSCSGASPDPFDTCGTYSASGYDIVVPDIIFGYQYAHTGARFMGLGFYSGWYEYIGAKLAQPLEAGETYKVSFWVSCADMMVWAAKDIGMYFSTTDISYPTSNVYGTMLNYTPQVVNTGSHLTDTIWQQVTGDFVAAGGEQWIVLGYFKPIVTSDFYLFPAPTDGTYRKANPTYRPTTQGSGTTAGARVYYYVDDVSVEKVSALPIKLTSFTGKLLNQQVQLKWQTASEESNCGFDVQRSSNGKDFYTIGTVAGAGTSAIAHAYSYTDASPLTGASYYRLQQNDCNGKSNFSSLITIRYEPGNFTIYPNPVSSTITISRNKSGNATATIYDLAGRLLFTKKITSATESIAASQLLPGTYIIKVAGDNGSFTQKFMKQ